MHREHQRHDHDRDDHHQHKQRWPRDQVASFKPDLILGVEQHHVAARKLQHDAAQQPQPE